VSVDVSPTVCKILTLKARRRPIFPTPPLFDTSARGNALQFLNETCPAKTRWSGLPYGKCPQWDISHPLHVSFYGRVFWGRCSFSTLILLVGSFKPVKTVARITYTVLVETLNHAQSINFGVGGSNGGYIIMALFPVRSNSRFGIFEWPYHRNG